MGLLNITTEGGDFDPYAKYNAKSGRWYFKDGEAETEVEKPTFVADFDNIKTGWMLFMEGQAPDRVFDESLSSPAPKPSDTHKRGFLVRLYSDQSFKGVVELSGTSMHLCNAINEVYEAYSNDKQEGKLPVVAFTGSTPMKDKFGTNYKPNFEIVKWVDRPEAFDAAPAQAEAAPEPAAVAATGASEF